MLGVSLSKCIPIDVYGMVAYPRDGVTIHQDRRGPAQGDLVALEIFGYLFLK